MSTYKIRSASVTGSLPDFSIRSAVLAVLLIASVGMSVPTRTAAEGPGLGVALDETALAGLDISITPDGANLPAGSGGVEAGKAVYDARCASCHGSDGAGGEGLADPVVGGIGSLDTDAPVKTVGSYWPYATTLFDYIRRAMPLDAPLSLTDDEVYAVSAYILSLNGIIEADATLDATSLAAVQMPNRDGFISKWPEHTH